MEGKKGKEKKKEGRGKKGDEHPIHIFGYATECLSNTSVSV